VALLIAGDRPGVRIERCAVEEVAARIVACHNVERRMPIDLQALVGFARPGAGCSWAEASVGRERACLGRALAAARACVVTLGPGSDPNAVWRRLVRGGW
jgi:hypothetical protein